MASNSLNLLTCGAAEESEALAASFFWVRQASRRKMALDLPVADRRSRVSPQDRYAEDCVSRRRHRPHAPLSGASRGMGTRHSKSFLRCSSAAPAVSHRIPREPVHRMLRDRACVPHLQISLGVAANPRLSASGSRQNPESNSSGMTREGVSVLGLPKATASGNWILFGTQSGTRVDPDGSEDRRDAG